MYSDAIARNVDGKTTPKAASAPPMEFDSPSLSPRVSPSPTKIANHFKESVDLEEVSGPITWWQKPEEARVQEAEPEPPKRRGNRSKKNKTSRTKKKKDIATLPVNMPVQQPVMKSTPSPPPSNIQANGTMSSPAEDYVWDGQDLEQNLRLERRLEQGMLGEVWKARHM